MQDAFGWVSPAGGITIGAFPKRKKDGGVMKQHVVRIATGGLLALGLVAALSAQPAHGGQAPGFAELLAELRAVRADLNQAASVSLRAQLLVARLSLQEQRITTLAKQLVDVQAQLESATGERTDSEDVIKRITEALSKGFTAEAGGSVEMIRKQLEAEIHVAKSAVARHQDLEEKLRGQESELAGMVANEQNRWTDFNSRLDEIERSLPGTPPR